MIIRVAVPTSRKGKRAQKARVKVGTSDRAICTMWGRRSQPGMARISANYRPRS
jgi:hypothetical protein